MGGKSLGHYSILGKLAAVLFVSGLLWGEPLKEANRARNAVLVDGVLEQQEWNGASILDSLIQFEPQRGEPAQERTEVYFLYDDLYVYFGFRNFDSQPSTIAAQQTQRDSDLLTDDSVLVILDTFDDSRSAYFFYTNLLGTQADGRIADNGRVVDKNWDASWISAASRFDQGWMAEIAIPFTDLRFNPGENQSWGLNVGRTCRRLFETSFWAGPLEDPFRISQYGTLQGLDLETVQRKYEVVPYMLGQFQEEAGSDVSAGVDIRYAFTPQDVFSSAINPDFAIIEADQEVINLTRFEVRVREKRRFFLEGAEQYRQRIQTFYTRRIEDIKAGAKFLGRRGNWQYSLLTAQSDALSKEDTEQGSANYTVLRFQRNVLQSSSVALMIDNRNLSGVNQGSVGLDSAFFFTDTFGFTGQLIRSHGPREGGRWAWFVRPSRDTATSHIHFRYTHLGDAFGEHVNAIGFIRDDDRKEMDSAVTKELWFDTGSLERVSYRSNYNIYWSQENVLRSWKINQSLQGDFRNRWSADVSHINEYKLFEKNFRNHQTQVNLGYNTREWQSVKTRYTFGHNFDSDFHLLGGFFRRKLTDGFSFEYELSRLWLTPDPGNTSTLIHVIRTSQNFTKDLFVKAFFQTNSAIERRNLQVVFMWRYKPPFGTIQFAYQRGTAELGQPSDQGNTFFTKFSYVFQ